MDFMASSITRRTLVCINGPTWRTHLIVFYLWVQLMFTRTLQLLPLVCKHVPTSLWNLMFGTPSTSEESATQWFQDLVALGSNSSRAVLRWWQDAILVIIEDLTHSEISISSALKQVVALLLRPGMDFTSLHSTSLPIYYWMSECLVLSLCWLP